MHVVKDDNQPSFTPEELMKAIEAADELSEAINQRENDCLNSIYTRFCLMKAILVDFKLVRRKTFVNRPNYWEYWYMIDTPKQFFLMSRELIVDAEGSKLNINFSKLLTKNNEL